MELLNERVVERLNRALHRLFDEDPRVFLLGEDLLDPYGGAFKVSRGLSTKHPDRVLATPLSEEGFTGLAGGLALCGDKPIVEIMFGDFAALIFDQVVNFAAKSVTMYGRRIPLNLVVRCTSGGNRGYGPTHSQSLQKHFLGVPNLAVFELSAFHDPYELLRRLVDQGHPSLLFEDKILYTQRIPDEGRLDDLFLWERLGGDCDFVRVWTDQADREDVVLLAPGGMAARCLAAARDLFLEHEIGAQILIPARLYPFDPEPVLERLAAADRVFVVEESGAGATWGAEVACRLYDRLWGRLRHRVELISSLDSIIPTAPHLEKEVLLQSGHIYRAVRGSFPDA